MDHKESLIMDNLLVIFVYDYILYQYIVDTLYDHIQVMLLDDIIDFHIQNHVNIWHNIKTPYNMIELIDLMQPFLFNIEK
jgi:hypothetical protein